MKIKKIIAIFGVFIIMIAFQASASATTVSISNATVGPDETAVLPIMIYDVTNVSGAYIKLSYDQSIVQVTDIEGSDLNFITYENISNSIGLVRYAAINQPDAQNGPDIRFADVTFKAVGGTGDSSPLSLNVISIQDSNYEEISRTVSDGTFMVISDLVPPSVTSPSANPNVIPIDTDNDFTWGETSTLNVTVSDPDGVSQVTVDLSLIGGSNEQPMQYIGSDIWSVDVSVPNGVSQGTYNFLVTAMDGHGNSNSMVNIELNVAQNGDVDRDGKVDLKDGVYLLNHALLVDGYGNIDSGLADVTGDGAVILEDGIYLVNYLYRINGYGILH